MYSYGQIALAIARAITGHTHTSKSTDYCPNCTRKCVINYTNNYQSSNPSFIAVCAKMIIILTPAKVVAPRYTCVLFVSGTWMLSKLKAQYCHTVQETTSQEDSDDMSGIAVDSPYKVLFESQEFPCEIQGIGEIRTSWIGQQGVLQIKRTVSEQKIAQQVKTLSSDLKRLACNCHKAFEKAGLLDSEDEVIKSAVELCQTHLQKLPQEGRKRTSSIASLWKQHTSTEAAHGSKDLEKHAAAVIGDKLVDTVTEKHREPPDVS